MFEGVLELYRMDLQDIAAGSPSGKAEANGTIAGIWMGQAMMSATITGNYQGLEEHMEVGLCTLNNNDAGGNHALRVVRVP